MSSVNGKLSSRVMNMKFMRFTKNDDNNQEKKTADDSSSNGKSFHDNSEWKINATPASGKVVKVKRLANVVSTIGITDIKKETTVVRGRRVIGEQQLLESKRKAVDDETKTLSEKKEEEEEEDGDDPYEIDLDTLFKESKHKKQKK